MTVSLFQTAKQNITIVGGGAALVTGILPAASVGKVRWIMVSFTGVIANSGLATDHSLGFQDLTPFGLMARMHAFTGTVPVASPALYLPSSIFTLSELDILFTNGLQTNITQGVAADTGVWGFSVGYDQLI
jgi:hypothetical protein